MLKNIRVAVCTNCDCTEQDEAVQAPERGRGRDRRATYRLPAGWRERGVDAEGNPATGRAVVRREHYCPDCPAPDEEGGDV